MTEKEYLLGEEGYNILQPCTYQQIFFQYNKGRVLSPHMYPIVSLINYKKNTPQRLLKYFLDNEKFLSIKV